MKYIKIFDKFEIGKKRPIEDCIKYVRGISNDNKEIALSLLSSRTKAQKGKITGLSLPSDFAKYLSDNNLPTGFDFGIDKDGFFVHTHRAKCKSCDDYMKIPKKSIIFIDSTG